MAEQQQAIAEAEAEKASAFAISQEDIDAVLMGGSHVQEGKFRIYAQYLKQETAAENVKFLKNEYGTGGAYPAVIGREISEDHDSKGIRLRLGSIIHPDADLLLSWPKVEKRIKELIRFIYIIYTRHTTKFSQLFVIYRLLISRHLKLFCDIYKICSK